MSTKIKIKASDNSKDATSVSLLDSPNATHTVDRDLTTSNVKSLVSDPKVGDFKSNANGNSDKPIQRNGKRKNKKNRSAAVKSTTTNSSQEINDSPRASSSLTLPTTTKYGLDVGDAFIDSIANDKQAENLWAYYSKTVTSFLRDNDNTVNRNFKNFDAFQKWILLDEIFAIDSPFREVMVTKESIKSKYLVERKISNVAFESNTPASQVVMPDMIMKSYTLNLDGGTIRGKITSTSRENGDTLQQNSILDRFNASMMKGILVPAAIDIISPSTNDIGIPAITNTNLPYYANKVHSYTTRFCNLKKYSSYQQDYGFNDNLDSELYVTDNIINKTNAIESMYLKIQKWNAENRGVLSGIANKQILTTTLNSTVPFITFLKITLECIEQCLENQGYIGSLTGAVDSTAASLCLKKNFDLNTIKDAVNEYKSKIDGFPYDVQIYNQFLKYKDAVKLFNTDSHLASNSVLCPTFKFATNTIYNYDATSTNMRTPKIVPTIQNRWDNKKKDEDWFSLGSDFSQLNGLDRRMIVGFKLTPDSVIEEIPHGSAFDIFMNYFFSKLYISDFVPYLPYFKTTTYEGDALSTNAWGLKDLWDYLTANNGAWSSDQIKPNVDIENPVNENFNTKSMLSPTSFTESMAINPVVSCYTFTGFMTAMCYFFTREKDFLDNFFNTLVRTKLYWKTLEEKIGLGPYFSLTTSEDTKPISFSIGAGKEPETSDEIANVFRSPFQYYGSFNSKFSRVIPVSNGIIRNNSTRDNNYDFTKDIYRQDIFVKHDGSTYYNPLNTPVRYVVYGSKKTSNVEISSSISNATQYGYNYTTDTICFNNDLISFDLESSAQYIGNHIGVSYNGTANKTAYGISSSNLATLPFLWGTFNFVYGAPYHPSRPRVQQRGLLVNSSDGYYQSVFMSAYCLPYLPFIRTFTKRICNIADSTAIGCLPCSPDLAQTIVLYHTDYVRNVTGLATISTLRRSLEEKIYNYNDSSDGKIDLSKKYIRI